MLITYQCFFLSIPKNLLYTLISSYPLVSISWGSSDCVEEQVCNTLEKSYVGDWLNNVFVQSLPSEVQSKLENMTYTKKVYNGSSVVSEEISNVKARLLTENEYTTYGGENSYLGAKNCFWLADIHSSHTLVRSIFINRGLNADIPTTANSIKLVIEISYVTILEGDGTLTSPYIGNTSRVKSVSDIAAGEYISIPKSDGGTYLARVVKHDQDGTKSNPKWIIYRKRLWK